MADESGSTSDESVWDLDGALKRINGKEKLLLKLVNLFLKSMPDEIEKLNQAIQAGDLDAVRLHAHTIKGAAGSLSANAMMAAASTTEQASIDGKSDELTDLSSGLKSCFEEVEALFKNYAAEKQA